MKRSAGMRYGVIYHLHLNSSEVRDLRRNNHKAYMLWLHLQALTFSGVDSWRRSMGQMANDLGCGASTLRRWAADLEARGLVRRESGSLSKEEQVWTLLTPPSVRGEQAPAAKAARTQNHARITELQNDLQSYQHTLDTYYSDPDNLTPELQEHRESMLSEIAALQLELEALQD